MTKPTEKPGRAMPAPHTHRNEFPARYSLGGCSPAEPASTSPADLILQPEIPFGQEFSADGNCRIYSLSHGRAQSSGDTHNFDYSAIFHCSYDRRKHLNQKRL